MPGFRQRKVGRLERTARPIHFEYYGDDVMFAVHANEAQSQAEQRQYVPRGLLIHFVAEIWGESTNALLISALSLNEDLRNKDRFIDLGEEPIRPRPRMRIMEQTMDTKVVAEKTDTTTTTTTISDMVTAQATVHKPATVPRVLVDSATTHYAQDIKSFLGKEWRQTAGTLGVSDTGLFAVVQLPEDIFSQAIYADKLSGFGGIRAKIRARLVVNGNSFQQGRIIMAFVPQGQVTGAHPLFRTFNLQTVTQLPHVELDIATERECDMMIPYVSPSSYYDIINNFGNWGVLYLFVYSPFAFGTGSPSVGYSLFFSFLDVELFNPTISAPTLIADKERFKVHRAKHDKKAPAKAQMASISEKEAKKKGPVSLALEGVAKIAGATSLVPMLSEIAGPVAWAASLGSKAAAAFGYSSPLAETAVRQTSQTNFLFSTSDGPDTNSFPLATLTSNRVALMDGFAGKAEDEAALDYILTKYAWTSTFTFSTQSAGAVLYSKDLIPNSFVTSNTDGSITFLSLSPLSFVGTFFEWYRGSIRQRYKLVKTSYHSGRLVVAYYPGLTVASAPTLDQSAFVHRAIIDLSVANEFEVEFPFVSSVPYLDKSIAYGCVFIYVLNELVAPSTVSNTITVLVETAGCSGFEYAMPSDVIWTPYIPRSVGAVDTRDRLRQKEKEVRKEKGNVRELPSTSIPLGYAKAQMASVPEIGGADLSKKVVLGGASEGDFSSALAAEYCVGERVTSLYQLGKRYALSYPSGIATSSWNSVVMRPFTISALTTPDGTTLTYRGFALDRVSAICAAYAYNRGSVHVAVDSQQSGGGVNNQTIWSLLVSDTGFTDSITAFTPPTFFGYGQYSQPQNMYTPSVVVPQYGACPMRLTRFTYGTNDEPQDDYAAQVWLRFSATLPVASVKLYRKMSDDFQVGGFLGAPLMVSENSLV